jgi:hypothetical protein
MTINYALEHIPRRMRELGVNDNYFLKFRHFVIPPNDTVTIDGYNEYFFLVQAGNDLKVRSEFGVYDLFDTGINEQQYEHQGKITITNPSSPTAGMYKHIKFIQVIPKHL